MIGDEAWDVDYFLHENPELKRFAFAWLTDFVGWLPMPDGGDARGGADRRLQRGDDRAAGPARGRCATGRCSSATPTTSCRTTFGPGLPAIRDWTEQNFDFAGYVTGFDPAELADRAALRRRLGYRPDERVCVVTRRRLRRRACRCCAGSLDAVPLARRLAPGPAVRRGHRPAHRPGVAARAGAG